jgi:hypothetical protein
MPQSVGGQRMFKGSLPVRGRTGSTFIKRNDESKRAAHDSSTHNNNTVRELIMLTAKDIVEAILETRSMEELVQNLFTEDVCTVYCDENVKKAVRRYQQEYVKAYLDNHGFDMERDHDSYVHANSCISCILTHIELFSSGKTLLMHWR